MGMPMDSTHDSIRWQSTLIATIETVMLPLLVSVQLGTRIMGPWTWECPWELHIVVLTGTNPKCYWNNDAAYMGMPTDSPH